MSFGQIADQQYFGQIFHEVKDQCNPPSYSCNSLVLSGFPYDEGTRRNGGRMGGSAASRIFRQMLTKCQLYPKKVVELIDQGDIDADLTLEEAHHQLTRKHTRILKWLANANGLLVSVGGSNDQSYPNVSALLDVYNGKKVGVINIDAHFDVRPLKDGKAHSGSPFRLMLEDERFVKSQSRFVEFACKGLNCSQTHYQYLQQHQVPVYWLETVIRRKQVGHKQQQHSAHSTLLAPSTQGGLVFKQVIQELQATCDAIFVSFDVDSISSRWMPGVSAPSVIGGLTSEEAREIVMIAGQSRKVKLVDFSQFNPAVEHFLSGSLMVELLYYLSESYAGRHQ